MGKKDDFLDYRASRKNREKRMVRKHRKFVFGRYALFFLVVLLSITAGTAVYFISAEIFRGKASLDDDAGYVLLDTKESLTGGLSGVYGLDGMLLEPKEDIIVEDTKKWMSDFDDTRTPIKAKGIYITFEGVTKMYDSIVGLIDRTELNTLIIDVKDDDGRLTFSMQGSLIDGYGTSRNYLTDINSTIKKLKEHNIYVIARIVSFKDPLLGKDRPDLVLHYNDGTVYKDYAGMTWLNPFKKEVLDYLIEVAENCAKAGFDEVNFDYIRYPTDGRISEIDLSDGGGEKTKIDAVTEAVKYLCENIKPLGLFVSADVFGGIITSMPDQRNVGQSYVELSKYLDYICPMIYPSHYGNGYYGVAYPDTEPYIIINRALLDSWKVLNEIDLKVDNKAVVRPWLQDFTASYLRNYIVYGSKEVRTQIEAVYDAGYEQWFLWNASMKYTEGALMTEEAADEAYRNRPEPTMIPLPEKGTDKETTKKKDTGKYYDSPWKREEN